MPHCPTELTPGFEVDALLPYVTDLEFEVDRLRRQSRFIEQQARDALKKVRSSCKEATRPENAATALAQIESTASDFAQVLEDLHEQPGYHPAHDQVVAIAIRPLIEQVFRWQQRLAGAPHAVLRLELEIEHLDWFPARLRHIVDNLIANALKYAAADKGESRITLGLRRSAKGYELRIADNGVGINPQTRIDMLELFYRAAPARAAGLGVGLAVVKLLVEQSGGSLTVESLEGQGTSFLAILPCYDIDDFLNSQL
jgi:signal transduction histidine kinase